MVYKYLNICDLNCSKGRKSSWKKNLHLRDDFTKWGESSKGDKSVFCEILNFNKKLFRKEDKHFYLIV